MNIEGSDASNDMVASIGHRILGHRNYYIEIKK